jgi:hypothetical protein
LCAVWGGAGRVGCRRKRARICRTRADSLPVRGLFRAHLANARAFAGSPGALRSSRVLVRGCWFAGAGVRSSAAESVANARAFVVRARICYRFGVYFARSWQLRARLRDHRAHSGVHGCWCTGAGFRSSAAESVANARAFVVRARIRYRFGVYFARTWQMRARLRGVSRGRGAGMVAGRDHAATQRLSTVPHPRRRVPAEFRSDRWAGRRSSWVRWSFRCADPRPTWRDRRFRSAPVHRSTS